MGMMMVIKKISLLFLVVSVSLLPTSFAGRRLVDNMADEVDATHEEVSGIHVERLLRMNAKDYGKYDPAPTFVKPPYKLIPN
ncbi:protein CASPARIAN STRIP INTEGRITY FACTOR 1-like [Rhododendron vialii]|uniref:protein CASPARIAN STRIP INTEGRITY FACTOR 1-like n=1 Tax=Rhododendron vialii TaxID=182163 RepID=UPI00265F641C|nr:protein CASPARIAN STRIP INTEGRITY FACTOR 1-like [Rhododendron vialii]